MFRSLLVLGGLLCCLLTTGTVAASAASPQPSAEASANFTCDGTYVNRTFKHVRVRPGDTCILKNSTVTGNLMARRPATVKVLDTAVRHNLMVRGATQDVVIGNRGCRQDPTVGNNLKVTKSHNVAICWMTTKNNIKVTRNDGRISLFHNHAGRSIDVSRNLAYVADPGTKHQRAGAIRLRYNTADSHIRLFDNHPTRDLLGLRKNSPIPEVK
jgi:hypothetical protein